ncbi:hypothetical protein WICPIJ_000853 [Wickerhamomyces pijperi]|uniref:C2H2-type domain-containing protein n=1 Tax=Wickerhamomyces pijperi TaxID=599730 RepID=A0A9P8QC07_WICPI|nr:hypothetical protein WICPIJ_000853 [Wickerhamomyces pijperi]
MQSSSYINHHLDPNSAGTASTKSSDPSAPPLPDSGTMNTTQALYPSNMNAGYNNNINSVLTFANPLYSNTNTSSSIGNLVEGGSSVLPTRNMFTNGNPTMGYSNISNTSGLAYTMGLGLNPTYPVQQTFVQHVQPTAFSTNTGTLNRINQESALDGGIYSSNISGFNNTGMPLAQNEKAASFHSYTAMKPTETPLKTTYMNSGDLQTMMNPAQTPSYVYTQQPPSTPTVQLQQQTLQQTSQLPRLPQHTSQIVPLQQQVNSGNFTELPSRPGSGNSLVTGGNNVEVFNSSPAGNSHMVNYYNQQTLPQMVEYQHSLHQQQQQYTQVSDPALSSLPPASLSNNASSYMNGLYNSSAFEPPQLQQHHQQQQHQPSTLSTGSMTPVSESSKSKVKGKASGIKKTYPCSICPKVFQKPFNLKSHMVTHSNLKPFECRYCQRAFARNHDRNRHELLHQSDGSHVCGCNLRDISGASDIGTLNNDIAAGVEISWGCAKKFSKSEGLSRHLQSELGFFCILPLLRRVKLLEQEPDRENTAIWKIYAWLNNSLGSIVMDALLSKLEDYYKTGKTGNV